MEDRVRVCRRYFKEQVEYCQKNHTPAGDLPQKDLTRKGDLLINM